MPITAVANYMIKTESNLHFRFRFGASALFSIDDATYQDDMEGYGIYGGQMWYNYGKSRFGGGVSGRILLTEDGNFGERSIHELSLFIMGRIGQLQPGFNFKLPLDDDFKQVLNHVVVLSVTFIPK